MPETTYRVALLDPDGKLHPSVIPAGVGGGGGGPQSLDFAFAGELAVRSGVQFWMSPLQTITLIRATVVLGTMPTVGTGTPVQLRLMLNGSPLSTVSVADGQRSGSSTTFTQPTITNGGLLSCDILGVPTSNPTKAADAVVQLWWDYA